MKTIVVTGKRKGTGKTTLIGRMLENLCHCAGVIKISLHSDFSPPLVTDEKEIIEEGNTDTQHFIDRGAEKVVLIKSNYEQLEKSFQKAQKLMSDFEYLLVESNSILDFIDPRLVIYLEETGGEIKESALKAREKADVIINDFKESGTISSFQIAGNSISCYKAHLIARALGIKIGKLGKKLDEEGIKVSHCQLGLF